MGCCCCSVAQLCPILWTPWATARQASLSFIIFQSLLKLMSIESVIPSTHLILCCPFFSFPQSFPTSGSFPMSQFFTSGGQSIGASASSSVHPMNIQGWFPLGLTGLISLQSKGLSRVFSNATVRKHQFFSTQSSLLSNSHIHTWLLGKCQLWLYKFCWQTTSLFYNMLSMFVIAFLLRSKHLLISWLQSLSEVIFEPQKWSLSLFLLLPIYLPWSGEIGYDISFFSVEL